MPELRAALALGIIAVTPAVAAELPLERTAVLQRLVQQDCGSCHGLTMKGGLGPDIRAATLAGRSVREIASIVLDGIPGTAMPPWHPLLSPEEAQWIASYLLEGGVQ